LAEGFWVDIGIVAILLLSLVRGYQRGLLQQTAALLGIGLGVLVALHRYHLVSEFLQETFLLPPVLANIVAFVLITMVISALVNLLGFLLQKLTRFLFLAVVDSIGGAGLGLVKGGVVVYLLLLLLARVPYEVLLDHLEASRLASDFLELTPLVQENLDRFFQANDGFLEGNLGE